MTSASAYMASISNCTGRYHRQKRVGKLWEVDIFTTSPSFPFVAAIKAGYNLLDTSQGQIVSTSNHPTYLAICTLILRQARKRVQSNVRLFFSTLTSHTLWDKARDACVLHVPLVQGWQDREVLTHIVTVSTRQRHTYWLFVHLMAAGFSVFPVPCPIVPLGQSRLRIIFHADHTAEQIEGLVNTMFT
jgi:8-amino-7-oxononanoate synthase